MRPLIDVPGVISMIPVGWGVCGSVMYSLCPFLRLGQQGQAVILGGIFMEVESSRTLARRDIASLEVMHMKIREHRQGEEPGG